MTLLDQWGRPIRISALKSELVTPTVTGVRHVFDEIVAPGLTPGKAAAILREAAQGDMLEFLTLAEEMEEREFQYRSVLGTRKTAIKGIEAVVNAPTEDSEDQEIADAVKEELVDRPEFADLVGHQLDALGKGYAVTEIAWQTAGKRWDVAGLIERDPRLFHFDRETRSKLRVRMQSDYEGRAPAPYKLITHIPKLKSGLPARNGLARIAVWAFLLKSYTLKDWAKFIEIHGMPLRLGKYGPAASPSDRAVLLRAVRNLGSDAAAIIPRDMDIVFTEVKGFSEKPFEALSDYLDRQISKIILGQTMTSDDGSSLSQAAIHEKVRIDIKEDDARQLAATLNRDLVRPWVDLNFGPRERGRYPLIVFPVAEPEDIQRYASAVTTLIDRGLEIEQTEVRDRIGHREPEAGAKLMHPAGGERPGPGESEDDSPGSGRAEGSAAKGAAAKGAAKNYRLEPCCPDCGGQRVALNAMTEAVDLDAIAEGAAGDWEPVMEPVRAALEDAFRAATGFEDLDRRLAALDLPVERLTEALADLQLVGHLSGIMRRKVEQDEELAGG